MALKKKERFEDMKGMDRLINYTIEKINQNMYPDKTIVTGVEGLGKSNYSFLTGMAINCKSTFKPCYTCEVCQQVIRNVIHAEKKGTDFFKIFNMSINGGKEAALEAKESFTTAFSSTGKKFIMLEECHRMDDEAQDVLLTPLENLPTNVYVQLVTTDPLRISDQLMSRFVELKIDRPKKRDMVEILKEDAMRRKLNIIGGDSIYEMIADWAENKPRAALGILEAMGTNCKVDYDDIRGFLNFIEIRDIIPMISSLEGSILAGFSCISDLNMDKNTHAQICDVLMEAIRIKESNMSFKVSKEDSLLLRDAVRDVSKDRLTKFLYNVAALPNLTRQGLLAAYLREHPYLGNLTKHNDSILEDELNIKSTHHSEFTSKPEKSVVPTMDALILKGTRVGKVEGLNEKD